MNGVRSRLHREQKPDRDPYQKTGGEALKSHHRLRLLDGSNALIFSIACRPSTTLLNVATTQDGIDPAERLGRIVGILLAADLSPRRSFVLK